MKKYLTISLFLIGAAFAGYAQDAGTDPVVVSCGEIQIHASELNTAIESLPDEYRAYASGPGRRAFAQDYLRMKLLASSAREHELDGDPSVKAQIALVVENTLASAELDRIRESIEIGDEDLAKAYEARADSYEEASARHILIAFEGSPASPADQDPLSEEEAKAKAEAIRNRILEGADFAELAEVESHDRGSAQRGGNLGSFGRGMMVPEFEAAVFEGPIGEVGPVVRTQFGYHVIEVLTRRVKSLDEVRGELEDGLLQEKMEQRISELESSNEAEFDEAYFGGGAPPADPAGSEGE